MLFRLALIVNFILPVSRPQIGSSGLVLSITVSR